MVVASVVHCKFRGYLKLENFYNFFSASGVCLKIVGFVSNDNLECKCLTWYLFLEFLFDKNNFNQNVRDGFFILPNFYFFIKN